MNFEVNNMTSFDIYKANENLSFVNSEMKYYSGLASVSLDNPEKNPLENPLDIPKEMPRDGKEGTYLGEQYKQLIREKNLKPLYLEAVKLLNTEHPTIAAINDQMSKIINSKEEETKKEEAKTEKENNSNESKGFYRDGWYYEDMDDFLMHLEDNTADEESHIRGMGIIYNNINKE